MSQSTEEIEAKLVAYIEGEIDEAGRAEIEKHLASNPGHRKLLEDLAIQRGWLREVPRAAAPAEILETVQQHLERKLLLDEEPADVIASIRPSAWPRVMAIAAVVLLTGTLALLVWSILPSQSQRSPELAAALGDRETSRAPVASTSPVPGAGTTIALAPAGGPAGNELKHDGTSDIVGGALAASPHGETGATGRVPGGEPSAIRGLPAGSAISRTPAAPTFSVDSSAPVLILLADDTRAAEREISKYAIDNKLRLDSVADQDSFTGGRGGTMDALKAAETTTAEAHSSTQPTVAGAKLDDQTRVESLPGSALAHSAVGFGPVSGKSEESIFAFRGISRAQAEIISQSLQKQANRVSNVVQQPVAMEDQQRYQRAAQLAQEPLSLDRKLKSAGEELQEKQELAKDISATTGPAKPPEYDVMPRRDGPVSLIAAGDRLKVQVALNGESAPPQQQTVTVGQDGAIELLGVIQPVPASGLTGPELEQKIAGLFTTDKSGAAPMVSVQRASDSDLTDLVVVVRQNTPPAPLPPPGEAGAPGATQPATAPGS